MNQIIFTTNDCPALLAGIYKINFPNGKFYIGLSNNIKRRILEHNCDKRQPVLYAAIQKYFNGKIPEFEILEIISADDKIQLLEKEFYYIQLYTTDNKKYGYNLTAGGNLEGVYNPQGMFTENDIENIYTLLKDNNILVKDIASIYNCDRNTIAAINQGKRYYHSNIDYPVRIEKHDRKGTKNSNAKFNEDILHDIVWDLQNTLIEYKILAQKYQCSSTTIGNICRGTSYKQNSLQYPLRKRNAVLNNKLFK